MEYSIRRIDQCCERDVTIKKYVWYFVGHNNTPLNGFSGAGIIMTNKISNIFFGGYIPLTTLVNPSILTWNSNYYLS